MMQPGGKRLSKMDMGIAERGGGNPFMSCPACGSKSKVRSSDEVHPHLRRLYYACLNFHCGMTWRASLMFESVISPSALPVAVRPAEKNDGKPPGHDFGQMTIFDIAARPKSATG